MTSAFTGDSSATAVEIPQLEQHMNAHPDSPLFARLADLYLRENRPSDALKLLLEGLRRFPSYPTALYILSKTQVMLRRYIDARSTLETLLRKLPGCDSASDLLERMQDLELKYPPSASVATGLPGSSAVSRTVQEKDHWSHRDDLLPGFDLIIDRGDQETDAEMSEEKTAAEVEQDIFDLPGEADIADSENLEILAMRLDAAKIPPLPESEIEVVKEDPASQSIERINLSSRPVTETLLAIYVQQGKVQEAIEGYRLMAERNPDRAEYFREKAAELEEDQNNGDVSRD